jgi:hypothetical protein
VIVIEYLLNGRLSMRLRLLNSTTKVEVYKRKSDKRSRYSSRKDKKSM